jgi:hypothetical protein
MNHAILGTTSLILVFALVMVYSASTLVYAQFLPPPTTTFQQPCVNNGTNVIESGKQLLNQENQCNGTRVTQPPANTCPTGSVLQNGVCVPTTTGICGTGAVLQNGVCVPTTTQTAPIANAGPDQTVTSGTSVTLSGVGTVPNGSGATITSNSWAQTSGIQVPLTGTNTPTETFTAPTVNSTTTLTFIFTVTDSQGLTSNPDSVTITITPTQ